MTGLIRGILAAAGVGVMTWGTAAWACNVQGAVVCVGTLAPVPGVTVTLTGAGGTVPAVTDGSGAFTSYVAPGTYSSSLDLTAAGDGVLALGDAFCGAPTWQVDFGVIEVDVPGCAPVTADCSPGFYKNHPETWCDQCFGGEGCDVLVGQLSTRGPESAAVREAAKGAIDACFGTAEASPCVDDDS